MEWESHIIALYEKFHCCCFDPPDRLRPDPGPCDRANRGAAPHKYACGCCSRLSNQNKYSNGSTDSDSRAFPDH